MLAFFQNPVILLQISTELADQGPYECEMISSRRPCVKHTNVSVYMRYCFSMKALEDLFCKDFQRRKHF
jgi:hypothetical protein